ncbi:MAG: hypothetical protein II625_01855 [Bacilli bacterium]|nr:hypothetical protein [Bacilli bacterium]
MTWGEIQKIALEKMFAKDEPISVDNLDNLRNDDDCKWYLSAMPSVCNEALERLKPYCMNMFQYNEETKKYDKTVIEHVDSDTVIDYEIGLPESACVLIPLYIASQLYKDDDIAQATAYRNEFEVGLQDLNVEIENQDFIKEVY